MNLLDCAKVYESKGEYNLAVKYYNRVIESRANEMDKAIANMQIANLYAKTGELSIAERYFRKAMPTISKLQEGLTYKHLSKTDIQYCKGLDALEEKNYLNSIKIFEDMLLTNNIPNIHYYLSIAYSKQANRYGYDLNKVVLPDGYVVSLSPEFAESSNLINQGCEIAKQKLRAIEEAKGKFYLAIIRTPDNISPRNNYEKALVEIKTAKYIEAIDLFRQREQTIDVAYYLSFACQNISAKHEKTAIEWLEKEKKAEEKKLKEIQILFSQDDKALKNEIENKTKMLTLYEDALKSIKEESSLNP